MSRPWAKRADELVEKEGHWADYAAFEEWFNESDKGGPSDERVLDTLNDMQKVSLYAACCSLADGTARELPVRGGA